MSRPLESPFVSVGVVILLGLLAVLQYRWIGEVSEAERERLHTGLQAAALRFADELDHEITRAFLAYHPGDPPAGDTESALVGADRQWLATAPYPGLVSSVYLTDRLGSELRCLDRDLGRFEPCQPPEQLRRLLDRLASEDPPPREDGLVPAVVVHLDRPEARRYPGQPPPRAPRLAIVVLDRELIADELAPELVERQFSGLDCSVTLTTGERDQQVIFSSATPPVDETADVVVDCFSLRSYNDLMRARGLGPSLPPTRQQGLSRTEPLRLPGPTGMHPRGPRPNQGPGILPGPEDNHGQWRLLVNHRAGSLAQAVGGLQRRNLAISAGILLLLAGSLVLIVSSTRRAQRLARQQLSFVAGVSHELKTPLAAIRSAADNLAHGVVSDPGRVREYGELVDREARRLTRMVSELLELAGMQARRRPGPRRPVDPARVVDGALEDCRWIIEEHGVVVERRVEAELPAVSADPEALRRAVQNLVENAVKHAGNGGWVAVCASADPSQPDVTITVADRGPGIDARDLPHVFEPFYRGCGPAAQATGSGLGLTLVKSTVEAHGGRVSVKTGPRGTAVTLHLPTAATHSST